MSLVSGYRTSYVGSENFLNFINVPTNMTAEPLVPAYHLMSINSEDNSIETNSSLEDVPDVTAKNQGKYRKTGASQLALSGMYLKGEPVSEFGQALLEGNPKANETTTAYRANISGFEAVAGVYSNIPAKSYACVFDITKGSGGAAGEKAKWEGAVAFVGDPTDVSINIDMNTGIATLHA